MPPKPRKSGPIQLKMSKSLKNQLRSVERMLRKPDLPPSMRKGAEDKRAKLQAAIGAKQATERERAITLKYKRVRFFERRKLMRMISKLKRALAAAAPGSDRQAKLEEEMQQREADMEYVLHYPKGKKYISLFPSRDADDPTLIALREDMRRMAADNAAKAKKEGREVRLEDIGEEQDDEEEQQAPAPAGKKQQQPKQQPAAAGGKSGTVLGSDDDDDDDEEEEEEEEEMEEEAAGGARSSDDSSDDDDDDDDDDSDSDDE